MISLNIAIGFNVVKSTLSLWLAIKLWMDGLRGRKYVRKFISVALALANKKKFFH